MRLFSVQAMALGTLADPHRPSPNLAHPRQPSLTLADPRSLSPTLAHSRRPSLTLADPRSLSPTLAHSRRPSLTLADPRSLSPTLAHSRRPSLTLARSFNLPTSLPSPPSLTTLDEADSVRSYSVWFTCKSKWRTMLWNWTIHYNSQKKKIW